MLFLYAWAAAPYVVQAAIDRRRSAQGCFAGLRLRLSGSLNGCAKLQ